MPITVQPLSPATPALPSYLSVPDADAVAAQLTGLTAWSTATSQAKANALAEATMRVDNAGPYQGVKYQVVFGGSQELEFPRLPYPGRVRLDRLTRPPLADVAVGPEEIYWDYDPVTNTVVVPLLVRRAVVFEADVIMAGDIFRVRAEGRAGLASQSIGGASESYSGGSGGAGGVSVGLSPRADSLVHRYRLRTGQLL